MCFNNPAIPEAIRTKYNNEVPDIYINNGSITSIETLDLYLARKKRGLTNPIVPTLIDVVPNENMADFIERVASRYDQSAPLLSELIRNGAKRFPDEKII